LLQEPLVVEDRAQGLDVALEVGLLRLQLDPGELRQPTQLEVEDVGRLGLREVEDLDEPLSGDGGVVGGADELDDLVDVEDGDEQTLDEVEPRLFLGEPVLGAAPHDAGAEVEEDLQQLLEAHRPRLAIDEGDGVDAEVLLHGGQLVELLEDRLGVEAVLDLEDESQAVLAVGEVLDVGDALESLGLDGVADLVDDLLRPDEVGQFGDDDTHLACGDLLDPGRGPGAERAATAEVGVADAIQSDDLAATGQVRTGDVLHQVIEGAARVVEQVAGGADDLDEVVRRHVRRHADGDAG